MAHEEEVRNVQSRVLTLCVDALIITYLAQFFDAKLIEVGGVGVNFFLILELTHL